MAEYSTKTEKGDCIFCEIANGNMDTPGIFWKEYFDDVGRVGLIIEGTGIDHAHIKLFPMHNTSELDDGKWKQFHSRNDQYFETYPGYISSNDSKKADEEQLKNLAGKLKQIISK